MIPIILLFMLMLGCIGQGETTQTTPGKEEGGEKEVQKPVTDVFKETPKIAFIEYPTELNAGENALFRWSVSGAKGTVSHTAVHYGKISTPIVDEKTSPENTNYNLMIEESSGKALTVPGEFNGAVQITEPGTYYARAHTVVEGKHIWSNEIVFTVKGEKGQPVREFTIKVSDTGFEPSEVKVNKGDLVKLHFEVAKEGTHPSGVRIISPAWQSAPILMPGDGYDAEITATDSFEYRLFWAAGNLLKATGKVTVE
ncbi:MAG: hypothetical protein ACP5H8_01310 [Candidatus Micrarchaeia archaeon]